MKLKGVRGDLERGELGGVVRGERVLEGVGELREWCVIFEWERAEWEGGGVRDREDLRVSL